VENIPESNNKERRNMFLLQRKLELGKVFRYREPTL